MKLLLFLVSTPKVRAIPFHKGCTEHIFSVIHVTNSRDVIPNKPLILFSSSKNFAGINYWAKTIIEICDITNVDAHLNIYQFYQFYYFCKEILFSMSSFFLWLGHIWLLKCKHYDHNIVAEFHDHYQLLLINLPETTNSLQDFDQSSSWLRLIMILTVIETKLAGQWSPWIMMMTIHLKPSSFKLMVMAIILIAETLPSYIILEKIISCSGIESEWIITLLFCDCTLLSMLST